MSKVTGKILLKGKLQVESPLIIGDELEDGVDIAVSKDEYSRPYIPATAFAGVLRHYFYERIELSKADRQQVQYFWGAKHEQEDEALCQSALSVNDLKLLNEAQIKVRDGVKIDPKFGLAQVEHKYDYEVVEPGACFDVDVEVTLRESYNEEWFEKILSFLINALVDGVVPFGAMTTKGFGRCRLVEHRVNRLNFSNRDHVIAWLSGDNDGLKTHKLNESALPLKQQTDFHIEALFEIKNSLLVKSYSVDPQAPDTVHIMSNGQNVLPGTSIKGAIKNRAVRIVNTLQGTSDEEVDILKPLFGWADCERNQFKSRIIVEETMINNENTVQTLQHRIRVDRFTGGVMKTALFDMLPIWPKKLHKPQGMVRLSLTIRDFKTWEAGLLLQILRDLWVSDLPIGSEKSIGRGVLRGVKAIITFNEKQVTLVSEESGKLNITGDRHALESFVEDFVDMCRLREEVSSWMLS